MPADRFAVRRDRLLRSLRETDVDVLLVSSFTNVSYLTGFSGDDSWLILGRAATVLVSDTRYATQLEEECPGLATHIRTNRVMLHDATATVLGRLGLSAVGVEAGSLTIEQFEKLKDAAKTIDFRPLSGLVETLRRVKDADEIAATREAVAQAERGYAALRATLTGDMTELAAAHDLEHAMRRFGAGGASFAPIVATGPRAALPHARPTSQRIDAAPFTLVDWGASGPGGYKSDLTRIFATAKISPKLAKTYGVVLTAQKRGIAAIRPGASCRAVDAAARKVIENAGHGKHFGHGLGHGLGLHIHEGPRFSPVSDDVLEPGMIVTVEPGIYLPGWGGIRIEDDVLVTPDGHEVLSSVPKELDSLPIG